MHTINNYNDYKSALRQYARLQDAVIDRSGGRYSAAAVRQTLSAAEQAAFRDLSDAIGAWDRKHAFYESLRTGDYRS